MNEDGKFCRHCGSWSCAAPSECERRRRQMEAEAAEIEHEEDCRREALLRAEIAGIPPMTPEQQAADDEARNNVDQSADRI